MPRLKCKCTSMMTTDARFCAKLRFLGVKQMSTIAELTPYLEQGFTLQNVRGESLRLVDRWVEWSHHAHWGSGFEAEKISLSAVAGIEDIWEWGVVFQQGR